MRLIWPPEGARSERASCLTVSPTAIICSPPRGPQAKYHTQHIVGRRSRCATRQNWLADVGSGSFTSLWLLRSTVRTSASHPKATEFLGDLNHLASLPFSSGMSNFRLGARLRARRQRRGGVIGSEPSSWM